MEFNLGKFGTEDIYTEWWALIITLLAVLLLVALIIIAINFTSKDGEPFRFSTRDLTYAAVCVAIAFALSFFGLSLAFGGTITFVSTLPIMIYCYYFGFRKGLVICTVFMLLQFVQSPYIISPWSALFDYVIPYMALCFLGLFSHEAKTQQDASPSSPLLKRHVRFFIGAGLYIVVRYISHVLSGILFFAEYKWNGWSLLPYSLAYNSFVLIDFAIAITASVFMLSSRSFNSFMTRSIDSKSLSSES